MYTNSDSLFKELHQYHIFLELNGLVKSVSSKFWFIVSTNTSVAEGKMLYPLLPPIKISLHFLIGNKYTDWPHQKMFPLDLRTSVEEVSPFKSSGKKTHFWK